MFSYQHAYHAGSFADLHKHMALIGILRHLQKKETAFCVMDTHAGDGLYDLRGPESQKTQEFGRGIAKIYSQKSLPSLAQALVEQVRLVNVSKELAFYPGSPTIIADLLRSHDRAIMIEHHPQAIEQLRKNLGRNALVHIHDRDSNEALLALLPFKEKRGLIFIDPSYEIKSEYSTIVKTLKTAYGKFSQGIFVLWYPLLQANYQHELRKKLQHCQFKKIIFHEWTPDPSVITGMYGSGLAIINAPWTLEAELKAACSGIL